MVWEEGKGAAVVGADNAGAGGLETTGAISEKIWYNIVEQGVYFPPRRT